MKKFAVILLFSFIICSIASACSINLNLDRPAETTAPAASPADTSSAADVTAPPTDAPTEAPAAPTVGALSDYVRTGREKQVSFSGGVTNTLRLPEILLDSHDAQEANAELESNFGDIFTYGADYTGAYAIDYEAYLNGSILSVVVNAKYDGGNGYGYVYDFDVLTGAALDNEAIASAYGISYAQAFDNLGAALSVDYEERWGTLPANETMKAKTFTNENLTAARLYLDGDGELMALAEVYAAVGGGHFISRVKVG